MSIRRYKTPAVAIIAQAVWSRVLVLFAQAQTLLTYTGFAIILFSGVAVVSLFVLRTKQPDAEPAIPSVGLSRRPWDLRGGRRVDSGKRALHGAGTNGRRSTGYSGGDSALFALQARGSSVARISFLWPRQSYVSGPTSALHALKSAV